MVGGERLEGSDSEQGVAFVAQGKEAERGIAQIVDLQHVARRRGRCGAHLDEVNAEERADVVGVQLAFLETLIASHGKRWLGGGAMVCPW